MNDDSKNALLSRTIWVSIIGLVASIFPPVQAVISAYPGISLAAASAIVAGLRMITSKKIVL